MQRRCALLAIVLGVAGVVGDTARPIARSFPQPPEALPEPLGAIGRAGDAGASERPSIGPWCSDRVSVTPAAGADLAAIARDHGVEVLSDDVYGHGVFSVPDDDVEGLLSALAADPRVDRAGPLATVRGAGGGFRWADVAWHKQALPTPRVSRGALDRVTIAVLDSGAASEDRTVAGWRYSRAPGLAPVRFVSPWDFVDGDDQPLDQHGHGTHITSLVAAGGQVPGVAYGVRLMPVRILDATNTGTEDRLIAGLDWAIDHGADVVNLSVAFPEGYVPSLPLLEVMERADEAGVVVVAAAGNNGASFVAWPAASPHAIAVTATTHAGRDRTRQLPAPYANRSPRVDIAAPGGDLSADRDLDGWSDGILAESVPPGSGKTAGFWLSAGTSQATAVTSGAVAYLLASGVPPDAVGATLQAGAAGPEAFADGLGAGSLDIVAAAAARDVGAPREWHVAVMPYLAVEGDRVVPSADLTIVDGDGEPATDVDVVATIHGEGGGVVDCEFFADGRCTLRGDAVPGGAAGLAWSIGVDAVIADGIASRPRAALFATDGLAILVEAMASDPVFDDAILAFEWTAGTDGELGPIADAYAIVDAGAGAAASPTAWLAARDVVEPHATIDEVGVDLDGTGLSSSPLGVMPIRRLSLDLGGSGLASSPLGVRTVTLAVLPGARTGPLALGAHTVLAPGGCGLASSPIGLVGQPILLAQRRAVGASLGGTALGRVIADGGWVSPQGYAGGSLLAGSALADVTADAVVPVARGDGATPAE